MAAVDDYVLPGDVVTCFDGIPSEIKIILGPGLRQDSDQVIAVKPGFLRKGKTYSYWVESDEKRYVPVKGDYVIGIVIGKTHESFKVDIGASEAATLSAFAFEGASKRNRPDVKMDDLVYAKLLTANKDMEPELVCIDPLGKSNGLGVLRDGGFMVRTSVSLARKILSTESPLLKLLGKPLPYEFAVGLNGRIWVKGRSTVETLGIVKAIGEAENYSSQQIQSLVKQISNSLTGL